MSDLVKNKYEDICIICNFKMSFLTLATLGSVQTV